MSTQDHKGNFCGCFDADECDRRTAEMLALRKSTDYAGSLRENLEILHDAMRIGGLTHTQGEGYPQSPRCEIVAALLAQGYPGQRDPADGAAAQARTEIGTKTSTGESTESPTATDSRPQARGQAGDVDVRVAHQFNPRGVGCAENEQMGHALLREWLDAELDPEDEEYGPWMESFTARVEAVLAGGVLADGNVLTFSEPVDSSGGPIGADVAARIAAANCRTAVGNPQPVAWRFEGRFPLGKSTMIAMFMHKAEADAYLVEQERQYFRECRLVPLYECPAVGNPRLVYPSDKNPCAYCGATQAACCAVPLNDALCPYNQPLPGHAAAAAAPGSHVGWLVERPGNGQAEWAFMDVTAMFGWTTDANKALRFCRRQDADAVAGGFEFDDARATEHMWIDAAPQTVPSQVRAQEGPIELAIWASDDGVEDNTEFVAQVSGPREMAMAEARRYAAPYAQDGDRVVIEEVTRREVEVIPSRRTAQCLPSDEKLTKETK